MRTHLVDSRSWQRAVCRSMSWYCLPGMLDLSSTHLGMQAALDAAEAVLAELKSSFPDKQYQLMLQRTALCQERESTK